MFDNAFWSGSVQSPWGSIQIGTIPQYPPGYPYPAPGYPAPGGYPYPAPATAGLSGDTVMALVVIGILLLIGLRK